MFEKVSAEVLAERERIAARVRDELAAAGLPVVAPGLSIELSQGAEVTVCPLQDCEAGVTVAWNASPRLRSCMARAAELALVNDPALRHGGTVLEAMLPAIAAILASAGFDVRDSLNDYASFTLEVLAGPSGRPVWAPHDEEIARPDRSQE
ncbi:hypothetical protein ABGB12_34795 [Actinocorallia sp. B10E7]|uniref:hypothetical protein n=1 Tax=Actinocorallia sp. B10E7 TaxID=3153558 RepID=UPI00325E1AB0